MKKTADIVIIGGGVAGCSCAYYLAKRGFRNIVLVEKKYITSGSTGRCAANFKEQWESPVKCEMGKYSIRQFKVLGEETGFGDLEVVQNGYMFTLYQPDQVAEFKRRQTMQNSIGVPTQYLEPYEVKQIIPQYNTAGLLGAILNPEDGHINPFKLTFAYEKGAKDRGVEFDTYTTVTGIRVEGGRVKAVITDRGTIETPVVINATEAETKWISRMVGLYHPVEPQKHEILITEPMDYLKLPMITSYDQKIYIHQMPHGGFAMGTLNEFQPMGIVDYGSSWNFLEEMCRRAVQMIPAFQNVRVIRQWAGHYGMTPDMNVILGPAPEVEGYILATGAAKSMMMSPAIGTLIAEILAGDTESAIPISKKDVGLSRFQNYFINPGGSSKKNMDAEDAVS